MAFKTCPACRQNSYSSSSGQIWICPCCGRDLSGETELREPRRKAFSEQGGEEQAPHLFVVGGPAR